jgi:hypothetical protein
VFPNSDMRLPNRFKLVSARYRSLFSLVSLKRLIEMNRSVTLYTHLYRIYVCSEFDGGSEPDITMRSQRFLKILDHSTYWGSQGAIRLSDLILCIS